MSSNARLLFDTHASLAYFNKERGSETIKHFFPVIDRKSGELGIFPGYSQMTRERIAIVPAYVKLVSLAVSVN